MAIREDYVPPPGFETNAQREARNQETARRKAAALAQAQAEEAKWAQASQERERPLRAYWESLTTNDQSALEQEAVECVDPFRRNRYEEAKRNGSTDLLSMYREPMLFDQIERIILKLEPSPQELATHHPR